MPGLADLQSAFQGIMPRIELHADIYFRHVRCHDTRAERVAETLALAWKWFLRLSEKGKDATGFPAVLAQYAARAVKSGRRACGQHKSKDVMNPLTQKRHGFRVESLPVSTRTAQESLYSRPGGQRLHDLFEERLVDNTVTPPAEQAIFRIDFAAWMESLTPRERRMVEAMAANERTLDISKMFELSPGRISQMRREFHEGWERFCGDRDDDPSPACAPEQHRLATLCGTSPCRHPMPHLLPHGTCFSPPSPAGDHHPSGTWRGPFMPSYSHSTGPPGTSLSERLGQLRQTFDHLAGQLHDGIARAIADAISGAVEQGLRKVLGAGTAQPTVRPTWPSDVQRWQHSHSRSSAWPEDESDSWLEADERDEDGDWRQSVASYARPSATPPATEQPLASRWLSALAVGVRSAFWWLSRHAPRRPLLSTVAIGIAVALAMLVAPATCTVGLGAIAVADAARAGTEQLASDATS
jgi:hypothetical protein